MVIDLLEFSGDLKKQAVFLMGLPAAGKSTFIRERLPKIVPGARGAAMVNSDTQLKSEQFRRSKEDYGKLSTAKDEAEFKEALSWLYYFDNDGDRVRPQLTWKGWQRVQSSHSRYHRELAAYYAGYFDVRDRAREITDMKFLKKSSGGGSMVVDTTGSDARHTLDWADRLRGDGFSVTIVYLEVDMPTAVLRDRARGASGGRRVGGSVISKKAKQIETSWGAYRRAAKAGKIHRLVHYRWRSTGKHPWDGTYTKVADDRFVDLKKGAMYAKRVA